MRERYVYCFGDSHTLGSGDPSALGWVGRVSAAAADAGIPIATYNLGVGGETSAQVLARLPTELTPRLPDPGADADPRLVLAIGANDTTIRDGRRRCEPDQSVANLARALDLGEERGLRSFVVGPAAIDDDSHNEVIDALSDRFAALCAERGVPYVGVSRALRSAGAWRRELAAGDGAHPGAAGYAELAQLVLDGGWLRWLAD